MKPSKEERDLDERIRSAIGRKGLKFDFDKWKAGHQNQIEQFKASVSRESAEPAQQVNICRTIAKSRLTKFAAAAVILVAAGLFFIRGRTTEQTQDYVKVETAKSPIEMIKAKSLNLAYRRGGMEAVERQYDEAFKNAGPRPAKLTIEDVLAEFNGG
jgi:hypothetical protein